MKYILTAILCSASMWAQEALPVKHPVERDIAPGNSYSYTIDLNSGDYVAGSIDPRGSAVQVVILQPDGSRLRVVPGAPESQRQFAFIADSTGTYKIDVKAPKTAAGGKYRLELTERLSVDERLKPAPSDEKYHSPAIQSLREQIAKGDKSTDAFWRRLAQNGTPIVEPVEGDEKHQLVTFVWRGNASTRNVLVDGSYARGANPADSLMTHLVGSDVWFLTVKLPRGARFAYRFSVNDSLASQGPRARDGAATRQADPLNKHPWGYAAEMSRFDYLSAAELPGAVPQPWTVRNPGTPEGKVETHRFRSEILDNERGLSVYTPHDYQPGGTPCDLLVLFDEGAYLDTVPTPVILDNLIAASKIPPVVAVLIANVGQLRIKELSPNPEFADFLARELVPWMRSHYNVTGDPKQTVVAGSSLGGIAATYAALRHPEVFGNVLSQSGSFWWAPDHPPGPDAEASTEGGWLAKEFIRSPRLPIKFYMDAGVFETDTSGRGFGILEPSRHMRDVLLAKGYEVHYQQMVGGHDYLSWRGSLADGLLALIGTPPAR